MGVWRIWATAEDLAQNKAAVISLYRGLYRAINTGKAPLPLIAREAAKTELRALFDESAGERSLHNIAELMDNAEYALSLLRKGRLPGTTRFLHPIYGLSEDV